MSLTDEELDETLPTSDFDLKEHHPERVCSSSGYTSTQSPLTLNKLQEFEVHETWSKNFGPSGEYREFDIRGGKDMMHNDTSKMGHKRQLASQPSLRGSTGSLPQWFEDITTTYVPFNQRLTTSWITDCPLKG